MRKYAVEHDGYAAFFRLDDKFFEVVFTAEVRIYVHIRAGIVLVV